MTLRNANFSGSSFSRSNLSGGKIYTTNLSDTHFRKAFLVRVEGDNVNFDKALMQDVTMVEAKFKRSDLRHTDMRRADLAGSEFIASDFKGADLTSASAQKVDFSGSHFIGARFDHANLQGAKLDGALLKHTQFGNAMLKEASFTGANLSDANLSQVRGLEQSQLNDACGNPATQLPFGLTVAYCVEAMSAENMTGRHNHVQRDVRKDKAAKHIDRAVGNLENMMRNNVVSDPQTKRMLQAVHADLMSARREIEK